MRYLEAVCTLGYDTEKCKGCGLCADVCPHGVFVMADKRARLTDRDLCMECGACMRNCEHGAIKVKTGVGCAAALIRGMVTGDVSCGCGSEADNGDNGKGACC
ncbi:MAG TPA: ferredoxin [Deltaproteobacteria bacterium]|nr:MAG: ferredoxin [Deltaproteobacteria bacterium GWA2_55_82]OGQ62200.1 MAG: ferredoxin [Deltaproteobacteria bacterium RIFCSPLOWO2_02_FULL_55_12]OIJ73241.1 MAG: ferredoxin [Deltaproteobacteria bacterium GWC2_55_46]HBG45496.1 ferredoxin [Deltaproteobacteria bacterium]HCY10327.1 ferredoxin [Deltaproteobacteria bacterium]